MNYQLRLLYVSLILLFSITVLSATDHLDSLYQAAKSAYSTDVDKALGLNQRVIDGARQKKDSVKLWQGFRQKGIILEATGDFPASMTNYQAALAISRKIKDDCGIGQVQVSLALHYLHKREYGDGLMYADSAIVIFEKICPNEELLGKGLINKGCILIDLESYEAAKIIFQRAKSLTANQDDLTIINENLALIYYEEDDYQSAKDIYFDNYNIYQNLKDIKSLAQVSNSLGAVFYGLNDLEKAREYFKQSVSFSKQVNSDLLLIDALINLGAIEVELDNIKVAESYGERVNKIIEESGGVDEKLHLANHTVVMYDYLEMYEAKSEAQEKVLLFSDSLNIIANQDLLQEKLAVLKMAEVEAATLTQKFYTASLAAVLFLSILVFFFFNNKSKEEKRTLLEKNKEEKRLFLAKIKEEEALTREKILDISFRIKQEIHKKIHDRVSNPLSTASIYIESFADDNTKVEDLTIATKIVDEAYDISRSIAHELLPYKIDWVDRINLVLGALERSKGILSKINFNRKNINQRTFTSEKGEKVAAIIGNLLVNVEKHAQAKQVEVSIEKQAEGVQILVEDDGIGFDPNQQTGIGLLSIRSNIKDLKGTLELTSIKGKGTKAAILIPIV